MRAANLSSWLSIFVAAVLLVTPARAVILFGSGDPTANTSAPGGTLAGSGWQFEGQFGGFLGTAIASNFFVTAKHIGGSVGDTFTFNGVNYTTVAVFPDPSSDLQIWQVAGSFPSHASLFSEAPGTEVNFALVVFGRGTQRGDPVLVGNDSHLGGWLWGASDSVQRWGTNVISSIETDPTYGKLLRAPFDSNAGTCSTRLVFLRRAIRVTAPNPSAFYATEIAAHKGFIESVVMGLTSVVSRKMHGDAGPFDVDLPESGTPGIECRSGGVTSDYTLVFTFARDVMVASASLSTGAGSVTSFSVAGNLVTVNLTGVTSAQTIIVTLSNVSDGTNTSDVQATMAVLVGDTTASGAVNSSDIAQTQSQSGQPVTSANFREDVTVSAAINSSDIALVQSKSGTALPASPQTHAATSSLSIQPLPFPQPQLRSSPNRRNQDRHRR